MSRILEEESPENPMPITNPKVKKILKAKQAEAAQYHANMQNKNYIMVNGKGNDKAMSKTMFNMGED